METLALDRFGSAPFDFMNLDGFDPNPAGLQFPEPEFDLDLKDIPDLGFDDVVVKTEEEFQSSFDVNASDSGVESCGGIKSEIDEEDDAKVVGARGTARKAGVCGTNGESLASKRSSKDDSSKTTRRRNRRTRTPKQQELNRLAQQRYRERKKQKYTSLQAVVDELSAQIDRMRILEAEKAVVVAERAQLQQLAAGQQQRIEEQNNTLQQQAEQMSNQAAQLKQQQEQLDELHSKLSAVSAVGSELENSPLYQRLANAIKAALVESGTPAAAAARVPEVVAQTIRNTLKACCREVTPASQGAECPCPPPSPSMISVSCY